MAVIKAVINKMISPKLLTNYSQILKSIEGNVEMSIPTEVIGNLVSQQLAEGGSWNVVSYSLSGGYAWEVSPLVGSQLSVIVPSQTKLNHAKQMIADVLAGKTVTP